MKPTELIEIGQHLFGKRWKAAFAKSIGVAPETVSRWVNGKQSISKAMAMSIRQYHDTHHQKIYREVRRSANGDKFQIDNITLIHAEPYSVCIDENFDWVITSPYDAKSLPDIYNVSDEDSYLQSIIENTCQENHKPNYALLVPRYFDPRRFARLYIPGDFIAAIPVVNADQLEPTNYRQVLYVFGKLTGLKLPIVIKLQEKSSSNSTVHFPLAQWVIQHLTGPEDTIFDPTMGDGQFANAAHQLQRKYIGVEPDSKYIRWVRSALGAHK